MTQPVIQLPTSDSAQAAVAASEAPGMPPQRGWVAGTEARKSVIHGQGLFATQAFRRGQKIGIYQGRRTRRDGTYVLWLIDVNGEDIGVAGNNDLRFMNHSSSPKAVFDDVEVRAIKDIAPNEEITIHYGEDWQEVD